MGTTTDVLNIRLNAQDNGASRTISNVTNSLEDMKLAVASIVSTAAITSFFKTVVTEAGELEQNLGGASAVFKSYANTIQASAASAYSLLGLSQSDYLANANKIGALLQGSGFSIAQSTELTTKAMQRAADVASIMGLKSEEAMAAIAGAAKGNFTMMDNLGVAINDTTLQIYAQEKGLGKLETTQQKVNAAMQMFIEKTEYAAGNYAKENETFAGSFQTLNAEIENAAASIGTALMPATMSIMPLISQAAHDVTPVIVTLSTGIGTIGQSLQVLEDPVVRGIAYAGAATVVIGKLNMAVGSTATGLILLAGLLTFVLGKYVESQNETGEAMSVGMDSAAASADTAAKSTDKLSASLGKALKAASWLAGFDEINSAPGNSNNTIASQIANAEDVKVIDAATSALDAYNSAISKIEIPELDVPKVNWDELKTDIRALSDDITSVFTGTETESYNALCRLNDRVELLFGNEFTTFWQGVGEDIFYAFDEFGNKKSYDAIYSLNEKIKEISFSETFTEITQKIGKSLGEGLFDLTNGLDKLLNGDVSGAVSSFAAAIEKNSDLIGSKISPLFGEQVGGAIGGAAGWTSDYFEAVSNNDENKQAVLRDQFDSGLQDGLESINNIKFLGDFEAVQPVNDWWNNFWKGVGGEIFKLAEGDRITSEPLTASGVYDAMSAALENSDFVGPVQINTTVELDGEKVGESVERYQNQRRRIFNGH